VLKLIPHLSEQAPGEVFVRAGKQWRRIAIIRLEDKELGITTPIPAGGTVTMHRTVTAAAVATMVAAGGCGLLRMTVQAPARSRSRSAAGEVSGIHSR